MRVADPRLASTAFGVLAFAAIVIAAVGVARLIGPMRRLKRRLAGYEDLPLLRGIATTRARLETTQANFAELDALLARADAALASMRRSLESLRASFAPAVVSYALALENVKVLRAAFASRSKEQ